MPKLGADMQEGKIVRWLKKEGERVTKGEIIAEVETDKADIEMEAYGSGIVRKILTAEGQVAPVRPPHRRHPRGAGGRRGPPGGQGPGAHGCPCRHRHRGSVRRRAGRRP